MNCPHCQAETVADATFCHQCGQSLRDPPAASGPRDISGKERLAAALRRGDDDDDAEEVLWQGRYSPRAMLGSWLLAAIATLGLILLGGILEFTTPAWLISLGVAALVWLGLGALLLYRQVNIHYYLTNQRVMHERGVLWREIDRIEAIDIDDVSFVQGPVERMFGVGRVHLKSSDVSTPEFTIVGIENVREVATMIDEIRRQERRRRGIHIESV